MFKPSRIEERIERLERHVKMLEYALFEDRPMTDRCEECYANNVPLFPCRKCSVLLCSKHVIRCWHCCAFSCKKHDKHAFRLEGSGKISSCSHHTTKDMTF